MVESVDFEAATDCVLKLLGSFRSSFSSVKVCKQQVDSIALQAHLSSSTEQNRRLI
jgi:hypothetical protein